MTIDTSVVSLKESLRLCVIEQALYSIDTPDDDLQRLSQQRANDLLEQIASRLPEVHRAICYLDVVFLLPQGEGGFSRGFVAAPMPVLDATDASLGAGATPIDPVHRYATLVARMVKDNFDVAGHPVFRAGLPRLTYRGGREVTPHSVHDLNEQKQGAPDSFPPDLEKIRESYFEWDFGALGQPAPPIGTERVFKTLAWSVKRENTEANYGGPGRAVQDNFAAYCALLAAERQFFADVSGRVLRQALAVPVSWWVRRRDGRYRVSAGGSLFLGVSTPLAEEQKNAVALLFAEATGAGYLVQEFGRAGQRAQQVSFAHQTSSIIDTIVQSIERLPDDVKRGMGGIVMAKLHLLRATINSYRTQGSRADMGDFPYAWSDGSSALQVYRDIGIQLGLARAQDGRSEERDVRAAGRAALWPENQPGQPGFDEYRKLFAPLPAIRAETERLLRHSSFAVLILLALRQSVYHALRARLVAKVPACVTLTVKEGFDEVVFECKVSNPRVTTDDKDLVSKDKEELTELADRLSRVHEAKVKYSVEGPRFDHASDSWYVITRVHSASP